MAPRRAAGAPSWLDASSKEDPLMTSAHRALLALLAVVLHASPAYAGALPTWDKKIDSPGRFKLLAAFDGAAVLDKETGLVWETSATLVSGFRNALRFCALRNHGGRMGWRMPALEELLTLVDQSNTTPALPDGAPFTNVTGTRFWTANEEETDPTLVVTVFLDAFDLSAATKTSTQKVLCVRGGRGSTTFGRGGL
jgi:hypothetical protein